MPVQRIYQSNLDFQETEEAITRFNREKYRFYYECFGEKSRLLSLTDMEPPKWPEPGRRIHHITLRFTSAPENPVQITRNSKLMFLGGNMCDDIKVLQAIETIWSLYNEGNLKFTLIKFELASHEWKTLALILLRGILSGELSPQFIERVQKEFTEIKKKMEQLTAHSLPKSFIEEVVWCLFLLAIENLMPPLEDKRDVQAKDNGKAERLDDSIGGLDVLTKIFEKTLEVIRRHRSLSIKT